MKTLVFSMYDEAAKAYTHPFFFHNRALGQRAFQDAVNANDGSNVAKHPDQFTLFVIGEWDDTEGSLVPLIPMESLGNGLSYKDKEIEIKEQLPDTEID